MRAALASLALAAVLLTGAAPAAAVPGNFWGVVPQHSPSPDQFQRLKRGGVDSVRIGISWDGVQSTRNGPFNWTSVDAIVASTAAARLDVLPFLMGAPRWAVPSGVVPGTGGAVRAPRFLPVRTGVQRSGWRRFVTEAVKRYGTRGTFWAENPGLPRKPIRFWQIGNEPNFKYFVVRPNPAEYGKLVKLSYGAAKAGDRRAKIVLAGLFARPAEALRKRGPKQAYFATDFLNQMYKRTPGVKRKFHGVALHPYTGTYKRLPRYIGDVRRVLAANRDAGKGMWITELGWSSERPRRGNSFAKGRKGQVRELKGAFGLLKRNQRRWRVQRVYWFSVDDLPGACNFCDGSGLFSEGFIPKPSWRAYVRFAGGRP